MFTHQFEQLMSSLPQMTATSQSQMQEDNIYDELDYNFVASVSCRFFKKWLGFLYRSYEFFVWKLDRS